MKKIIFILIIQIQFAIASEEHTLNCSTFGIKEVTSKIAVLKASVLPIDLDSPEQDAKKRIGHEDFRLIAIPELTIRIPGISSQEDYKILCYFGVKQIDGMTHAAEDLPHLKLMGKFKTYISKYNQYMIEFYRNEFKGKKSEKIKDSHK